MKTWIQSLSVIAHTYNPNTSTVTTGQSLGSIASQPTLTDKNQVFERISQRESIAFPRMTPKVVLQLPQPCTPTYKHAHTDTYTCTKIKIRKDLVLWDHWGHQTSPDTLQGRSCRAALKVFEDGEHPISAQSCSQLSNPEPGMWTKVSHHLNSGGSQSTKPCWSLTHSAAGWKAVSKVPSFSVVGT